MEMSVMALNRTAVLSFAALAFAAGSALAQSNEDAPMPGAVMGSHRVINLNPDGFGSRTLGVVTVYDSADFDAVNNPSYTGFTQAWCADWGNADLPRTGAGTLGNFAQTVEEVSFGISNNAAGVFNDVIITFYDNPKNWEIGGVANTGGFQAAATTVLGAFIVELPGETSLFPTFDAFTVTGLSARRQLLRRRHRLRPAGHDHPRHWRGPHLQHHRVGRARRLERRPLRPRRRRQRHHRRG
jgi:hypothetical protein